MNPELEYDIGNKDVGTVLKPATPSVIRRGLCVLKYEGSLSLYLYMLIFILIVIYILWQIPILAKIPIILINTVALILGSICIILE